jgi:hypothetical protein
MYKYTYVFCCMATQSVPSSQTVHERAANLSNFIGRLRDCTIVESGFEGEQR